jgi:hypothetical protein
MNASAANYSGFLNSTGANSTGANVTGAISAFVPAFQGIASHFYVACLSHRRRIRFGFGRAFTETSTEPAIHDKQCFNLAGVRSHGPNGQRCYHHAPCIDWRSDW